MVRRSIALIVLLVIAFAGPAGAEVAPHQKPDIAVFDQVWRLVDQHFYDRDFRGRDWRALRDRYRPLAEAALDDDAQAKVISDMLAELGASHTARYRQNDPAYYQLVDIFYGSLRREARNLFPNGVRYPGIGLFTRRIGDKLFVSGTIAGLPAEKAGVLVGDEIVDVDGKPFAAVESFGGKAGQTVTMHVRRAAGGAILPIAIKPVWIEP